MFGLLNSTIFVNGWPVVDMFLFKYLSFMLFQVASFIAPVKDGVSFPSMMEEDSKYPHLNASISPEDQFSFLRGFFVGVSIIIVSRRFVFVYNLWQIRAKREFYLQWRVTKFLRYGLKNNLRTFDKTHLRIFYFLRKL